MDIKIGIIALTLVGLIALFAVYRRSLTLPFLIAVALSLTWTAYHPYTYSDSNVLLFSRINIYPLVLWTGGLTALYALHLHMPKRYGFLATVVIYYFFLAAVETIGYHYLNIRLASDYTSLLELGIIHAPVPMKIFYVLAGPAYILLTQAITQSVDKNTKVVQ